jgi:pentatricopeptide repeat protein
LRGNVDEARRLLTKMRLNGVKENVATHLSILKGLSVAGKSEEAIGYFSEMIRKGMKLDAKEHEVVITAYCKMRKPDEAISLLKEMQAKGISRSVGSFNAVLRILVEIGELDKAVLLLKQVKNMGCLPNLVSYSTVICGLCRSHGRMQEVAGLVDDMLQDGFEMDATLYSCLVGGFCEAGNEEMAMRAFYDSINKNYVINLQSFSFFVNLMWGKGKVIEAEQIFKDRCRRCSLVDVDSYQRVLDDQLHKHSGRR